MRSGVRLRAVPRRTRINIALTLMSVGIVLNIVVLIKGDSSPGWPLAAVILFGAASVALLAERRGY
jgi:hypothetical protein